MAGPGGGEAREELVEAIVHNLRNVGIDLPSTDEAKYGVHLRWPAVAREVIRLMEWSRLKCTPFVEFYPHGTKRPLPYPLTLPPDDWRP